MEVELQHWAVAGSTPGNMSSLGKALLTGTLLSS